MSEKRPSRGDKGNCWSWGGALLESFRRSSSSRTAPEVPPPYRAGEGSAAEITAMAAQTVGRNTINSKPPVTSPARIMGLNEYGQVVGYISPAYPTASWFNFQPAEKALIVYVPIVDAKRFGRKTSSKTFRLPMRNVIGDFQNPTAAAAAGGYMFLGIHFHNADTLNESWTLAACDRGKSDPIFKDRANMLRSDANAAREGSDSLGNPASSNVWSLHATEGAYEELRLNWPHKDGRVLSLKMTSEKVFKGTPPHMWARRGNFMLGTSNAPIRLIVERCSES
ncbi:hypothetical protein FRB96_004238 [Tulasnella sp. 330]|nr:hypothetical protein FRB96_004238 [Tulasnella sp. 330]KAG8875267.1 hypothetical protein FRB97_005320 [Tulasnella sp. 331]